MSGTCSSLASGATVIALSELYAPATPMQPSSTRYLKPSVALRAEPFGSPFSAWSTNSYGRSRRPDSTASSKAMRWILSKLPPGPSRHAPSQPILMGSMVRILDTRLLLPGGAVVVGRADAIPPLPHLQRQLRGGVHALPGDLRRAARPPHDGRGARRRAGGHGGRPGDARCTHHRRRRASHGRRPSVG